MQNVVNQQRAQNTWVMFLQQLLVKHVRGGTASLLTHTLLQIQGIILFRGANNYVNLT